MEKNIDYEVDVRILRQASACIGDELIIINRLIDQMVDKARELEDSVYEKSKKALLEAVRNDADGLAVTMAVFKKIHSDFEYATEIYHMCNQKTIELIDAIDI